MGLVCVFSINKLFLIETLWSQFVQEAWFKYLTRTWCFIMWIKLQNYYDLNEWLILFSLFCLCIVISKMKKFFTPENSLILSNLHIYFTRYIATVDGLVHKKHLMAISEGTTIEGIHCVPDMVELLPRQPDGQRDRLRIVVNIFFFVIIKKKPVFYVLY